MRAYPNLLMLAISLVLSPILSADQAFEDTEATGAFLVKLKASGVRSGSSPDEWELSPLEEKTRGSAEGGWWYLAPRADTTATSRQGGEASTETGENAWDKAYEMYEATGDTDFRGSKPKKTPFTARRIQPRDIQFIEPDVGYLLPVPAESTLGDSVAAPREANIAVAGASPIQEWPGFSAAGAYQEAMYSQLREAREIVQRRLDETPTTRVRVAFLDTGFDPNHVACPPNINYALARNFVEDKRSPDGASLKDQPGPAGKQSHGTGTLGIFGGGKMTVVAANGSTIFSGTLGGAPMAEVAPMRVASSVVHVENLVSLRPSGTTRAIRYAIRQKCDIISMSHGGLPSKALAEAVNAAYENGIAMFFASGDYLEKPGIPFRTPRYVVYPAAFSRAMCVCGVTADNTTYGRPPHGSHPLMRGNWGPAAWMRNAIAAFSPNVPWPHQPDVKRNETREDVIDLNGQGTSASTPQAAAAAALWLQYHKTDPILTQSWNTWRKAELVYAALRSSAKTVADKKYSIEYFGHGILQAKAALERQPGALRVTKQNEARVKLGWIRLLLSATPVVRAEGAEVLDAMLNLEIAQLVQRSVALQDLVENYGGFDPEEENPLITPGAADFRREFFEALRQDPRCSKRLSKTVSRALAQ